MHAGSTRALTAAQEQVVTAVSEPETKADTLWHNVSTVSIFNDFLTDTLMIAVSFLDSVNLLLAYASPPQQWVQLSWIGDLHVLLCSRKSSEKFD